MAGHSHSANIKHRKDRVDAKRGKVFSRLGKALAVAARHGGGDVDGNPALRLAVEKAKAANMPRDTIERAILKGTGGGDGAALDEITYEGYGPSGVAILLDILTDNKNRTASEVRKLFDRSGGNLAGSGSVAWIFQPKGIILIKQDAIDEDSLMELALEAGADDVQNVDGMYEVTCPPTDFTQLSDAIKARNIETELAEVTKLPQNTVKLDDSSARKVLRLTEALDDHDDVQNVYANYELSEKMLAELGE
ncbi:MAG: YebC/PmpR family DNA-binding transcriptional regulator [Planctomycetes bacterium]|nr:YebC/PmpR family DNA-binding transcriptional regulator [Planctomycetota bacterium]